MADLRSGAWPPGGASLGFEEVGRVVAHELETVAALQEGDAFGNEAFELDTFDFGAVLLSLAGEVGNRSIVISICCGRASCHVTAIPSHAGTGPEPQTTVQRPSEVLGGGGKVSWSARNDGSKAAGRGRNLSDPLKARAQRDTGRLSAGQKARS